MRLIARFVVLMVAVFGVSLAFAWAWDKSDKPQDTSARRRFLSTRVGGDNVAMTRDAVHLPPPSGDLRLGDFDFELPAELIAQHPARRAQRLAPARRHAPTPVARPRSSASCPRCCAPATCSSFNDTRVIKARLFGAKASGGAVEVLVERVLPADEAWAHISGQQVAAGRHAAALRRRAAARPSRPRCSGAAGPTTRCSTCAFRATSFALLEQPRPRAAAALHRARRRGRRRAPLPDGVRRRGPARSRRRPRRCTSTTALLAAIAARGVERAARDAARRRRHVPAGAQRRPRRAHDAHRVVRGRRRPRSTRDRAHARARRPRRRGRHDHACARSSRRRCGAAGGERSRPARGETASSSRRASLPRRRPAAHQLPPAARAR